MPNWQEWVIHLQDLVRTTLPQSDWIVCERKQALNNERAKGIFSRETWKTCGVVTRAGGDLWCERGHAQAQRISSGTDSVSYILVPRLFFSLLWRQWSRAYKLKLIARDHGNRFLLLLYYQGLVSLLVRISEAWCRLLTVCSRFRREYGSHFSHSKFEEYEQRTFHAHDLLAVQRLSFLYIDLVVLFNWLTQAIHE